MHRMPNAMSQMISPDMPLDLFGAHLHTPLAAAELEQP